MKPMIRCLFALFALLLPLAATAQQQGLEIDIVGGHASALPITVVPMPYEGGAEAPDTDVAAIIRANLTARPVPHPARARHRRHPTRGAEVQYPTWRMLRQDFLVIGRVLDAAGGGYRVEYELFDVAKQERLLGMAMTARASAMRDVAHQVSDAIYEAILGVPGAFWTRIAYITQTGAGENARYALIVADSDGHNPQTVVRSNEPLLSPSWSPDGGRLAYVSFGAAIRRSTSRTSPPEAASWSRASGGSTSPEFSPTAAGWR